MIGLAIAPRIFIDNKSRNLLLINIMYISPIILFYYRKLYKNEIFLFLFLFFIVIAPLFNHPESMRWSTVLYTYMFSITFFAYQRLLYTGKLKIKGYLNTIKILLFSFTIVLIIQQFCVLTGLPIFNVSNYSYKEPWKLNSLAIEASYSARIVGILMYCYIVVKEIIKGRKYHVRSDFNEDKWVWLAFLWTMVTMNSGTAFLFIPLVMLKVLRGRNLVPLFILFGVILFIANMMEVTAFERTASLFFATFTLDINAIAKADLSGAYRIIPLLVLLKKVSLVTVDGWFGHGIDYVGTFLDQYIAGAPEGLTGGGLLQVWMEYGFIGFILIVIFSIKTTWNKREPLSIVYWFLLVFIYSVNIQIFWLCIALLFTNNYFQKITRNKLDENNTYYPG